MPSFYAFLPLIHSRATCTTEEKKIEPKSEIEFSDMDLNADLKRVVCDS